MASHQLPKGAWDIDGSPSAMDAFKDLGIQNLENNNFPKMKISK